MRFLLRFAYYSEVVSAGFNGNWYSQKHLNFTKNIYSNPHVKIVVYKAKLSNLGAMLYMRGYLHINAGYFMYIYSSDASSEYP